MWAGQKDDYLGPGKIEINGPLGVCVVLKSNNFKKSKDNYFVLEIVATNIASTIKGKLIKPNRPPLRIHFYRQSINEIKIVALERDLRPNFNLPLEKYSNLIETNHYYNDGSPDMQLPEISD